MSNVEQFQKLFTGLQRGNVKGQPTWYCSIVEQ